jgi:hypothetical protein
MVSLQKTNGKAKTTKSTTPLAQKSGLRKGFDVKRSAPFNSRSIRKPLHLKTAQFELTTAYSP